MPPPARSAHLRVVGDDYEPIPKGTRTEAREHLKVVSRRYNALTASERAVFREKLPNHDDYRWMTLDELERHYWIAKAFYASMEADRTRFHKRHLTVRCALVAVLGDRFGDADGTYLLGSPDLKTICALYSL